MKKLIAIALGLLLLFNSSNAQSFDTTQYYGKMNYVFQNVNKAQITTGILRDYGIEFLNPDNYQGSVLHDSNYVALDDWRMCFTPACIAHKLLPMQACCILILSID